ncbi:MAG TPA: tail fiber protein [Nocardioides sp.]|nr:tail fiber protein [Nocardioides sp.]
MAQPYVGEIRMFAGNFPPLGWSFCDGQLVAISENDTLFNLIGTTYGGDGQETFALPDLRGRLPLHLGQGGGLSSRVIGESGGIEQVTLTTNQIPAHSHPMLVIGDQPGSAVNPGGKLPAQSFNIAPYINDAPTGSFSPGAVTATGGSQPHENFQPYLCLNFIISMYGIYPSPT